MRPIALVTACLLAGACGDGARTAAAPEPRCHVVQPSVPLPPRLAETSGAAVSTRAPGVVWTHNDSGGETELYAVRPTGELLATVAVLGARNEDWEDLAAGPCPGGACLYIADIGDNEATRAGAAIYRVPEPDPAAPGPVRAERFPVRYPGGPRDAESLFVLPSGELYILTKGRTSSLALYRYPQPFRADETVELERVAEFSAGPLLLPDQVTAASVDPGGRWLAVRDYSSLRLYPAARFIRGDTTGGERVDLSALDQPQGEAVAILENGRLVLTSEGMGRATPGVIAVLACSLDDGAPPTAPPPPPSPDR